MRQMPPEQLVAIMLQRVALQDAYRARGGSLDDGLRFQRYQDQGSLDTLDSGVKNVRVNLHVEEIHIQPMLNSRGVQEGWEVSVSGDILQ